MMNRKVSQVQKEAMAVSADMRDLYSHFKAGNVKREDADTFANIAGKNLKALAIVIADQMREDAQLRTIENMKTINSK